MTEPARARSAAVRSTAQPSRGAHPADVADQLRRERHRDDDGDADLVERRRARWRAAAPGEASEFAAPMQASIVASTSPWYTASEQLLEA